MTIKIAVIGQGYVGLPAAIMASEAGYEVFGVDSDLEKINKIKSGISSIEDVSDSRLRSALDSKRYLPTNQAKVVSQVDVVLICVPTPLDKNRQPDLSFLISAIESAASHLKIGTLFIIESTVQPGTTRAVALPLIEKVSGLSRENFFLAFSPERLDPTNKSWRIENTPKLISGFTDTACEKAFNFYSKFISSLKICESLEIAETAKLLENTFRLINISFINEFAIFCTKYNLDVNKVIEAASTKPYGFIPFYPSVGVGGHCIPVDPVYLASKAKNVGAPTRFIDLAVEINQQMAGYFVSRAEERLGVLKGKSILVVGVSYKPNVADVRETPVAALIQGLKKKSAEVSWHDDLVKEWSGEKSSELSSNYDLAIIATHHDYLDLSTLGDVPVINTSESI